MTKRQCVMALSLSYLVAGGARAGGDEWSFDSQGDRSLSGHGQISIGYQVAHTEGLVNQDGDHFFENFATDVQSLNLAVDYWLNDRWSVHASLPFISKRAVRAPPTHNPAVLTVPHPESRFIDDGQYHSAWQDWLLGLTYHTSVGTLDIEPHVFLTYPSHDYIFFGAAAVGQDLKKLRVGVDLSQRLGQSNFHYSAGYSYEFVERIRDIQVAGVQYGNINTDKQHLRLSAWYDFSPTLSASVFANRRKGKGLTNAEVNDIDPGDPPLPIPIRRTELWYQHDRLLTYDYALAGLGTTWRFNEQWAVSASVASMVWVRVNYDLKYAYNFQVRRNF